MQRPAAGARLPSRVVASSTSCALCSRDFHHSFWPPLLLECPVVRLPAEPRWSRDIAPSPSVLHASLVFAALFAGASRGFWRGLSPLSLRLVFFARALLRANSLLPANVFASTGYFSRWCSPNPSALPSFFALFSAIPLSVLPAFFNPRFPSLSPQFANFPSLPV